MTLDLDLIKARLAVAAPGPWRWVRAYEHRGVHWCLENDTSAALGSTINHNLVTLSTDEYEFDDDGESTSLSETPDFQLIAKAPTDLAALIAEVERLRIDLEHAENEQSRLSYEARTEIERLRGLPDLIRQVEARGWLWEVGCNQGPHEPDRRYYAYLRLSTLDPLHEDVADEREGWGATVEAALRQAIAALPPDPCRRES